MKVVDFRFFYLFCSLLVNPLEGERVLNLDNFKLKFDRCDSYWSRLISKHFKYELEIENWLRGNLSPDVFFIDCGANIGYWSLFVSKVLNVKRFLAIEPNPHIFRILKDNFRLNDLPPSALQAVVGEFDTEESTVDLFVNTSPGKHVGASIFMENNAISETFQVPVFDLSELFNSEIKTNQRFVLKLDVEGAEISCLKKIPSSLKSRVQIIYEDHGRDRNCLTTKWLLDSNSYQIFFLKPNGSVEIESIQTLVSLKESRTKGYNLVAIPK